MTEKAVTKEGLIKSKGGKHEKDDRPEIHQRQNYVLGWDNRDKISALQKDVHNLQSDKTRVKNELQQIEKEIKDKQILCEDFSNLFYKYEKFDEIDWQSYAQIIQRKNEEKKQLEEANDRVKTLQKQLKDIIDSLDDIEKQHNQAVGNSALVENKQNVISDMYKNYAQALALIENVDTHDFESNYADILTVELFDIESKRSSIQNTIDDKIGTQKNIRYKKCSDCKDLISNFKRPSEDITTKYRDWRSDVNRLPDSIEFVSEYQLFLNRLYKEDLPSFESEFNKYLQDTITHNVNAFRMFFENWEDSICKTITQLNSYLKDIDFNSSLKTYIQLEATKKLNVDTTDFRKMLKDSMPNMHKVNSTIDGKRLHFEQHIEPLMQRLQDEQWRKNVMDVRGWFTYKAVEYYKEDNQKRNTYESMGQLSGGEKAQLTYTILGSAIAYQFGLTKQGYDSSFRFIAIDEAFRAQDEDKAHYLFSLCKQLHLQLLVVTPSDNIHIVENDISYVHYVERKDNISVLYNMPINEFKEERQKFFKSE